MSRGPVLTLLAVLALAAVLFGINTAAQEPGPAAPDATTDVAVSAPPKTTPPPLTSTSSPPPAPAGAAAAPETPATPFPSKVKYVGTVDTAGGRVPVAVTIEGDRSEVYVCDGKSIEAWLQGSARDGVVEADGRRSAHLGARHVGDHLTGTVTLPGHPIWTFTATPVRTSKAGAYRASGGNRTNGWVVPDDTDRQVGLVHDSTGAVLPARPLNFNAPLPFGTAPVGAATDVLAGP